MFALSKVLGRSQSLRLGACNAVYAKLDIALGERNGAVESNALVHVKCQAFSRFYDLPSWSSSTERSFFSDREQDETDKRVGEMHVRAFKMTDEWLAGNNEFGLEERDYASQLDLIIKLRGLHDGESYMKRIPESLRGELVYHTLLSNYVESSYVSKSEEVFNKMKNLGFPLSTSTCDQMLTLYKRFDKKKLTDVLLLMEKENLKPSLHTYKILIHTKGSSNDIIGMEKIVETMKSEGVPFDLRAKVLIARNYASAGFREKAEKVLKEMEDEILEGNRHVCKDLLSIYGSLKMADEVTRIWKICEENPYEDESLAAILAFEKIGKVKEAEAVFKKMDTTVNSALMKVYADHKMLPEGLDLIKQMNGCNIQALTWDAVIKLYVEPVEI